MRRDGERAPGSGGLAVAGRRGRRGKVERGGAVARDADERAVYVISVAAELAGLHPQTLRIYERRGLVEPKRTEGGSRRYSERDIAHLRHILDLTESGLNLEGVKRVLELEAEVSRLRAELEQLRREARQAVEQTHRQYRRELVPLDQSPVLWWGRRSGGTGRPGVAEDAFHRRSSQGA